MDNEKLNTEEMTVTAAAAEKAAAATTGDAADDADATISPIDLPDSMGRWIKRLACGALIGVGSILPGVSGGAFCAAFGVYRPLMDFIAHPARNLKKNALYFIPILLGVLIGFVGLSGVVAYLLNIAGAIITAFFVGCIAGTLPSLYKEANGRQWKIGHYGLLVAAFALTVWALLSMSKVDSMQHLLDNPGSLTYILTWLVCGIIFALGFVVPGMSPSSIIMYAGLYQPMTEGFARLNMSVLLPFLGGVILCAVAFSKLISWLFDRAGRAMFSFVIGVVIASTVLVAWSQVIVPIMANFSLAQCIGSIACFIAGTVIVLLLAKLDPR